MSASDYNSTIVGPVLAFKISGPMEQMLLKLKQLIIYLFVIFILNVSIEIFDKTYYILWGSFFLGVDKFWEGQSFESTNLKEQETHNLAFWQ